MTECRIWLLSVKKKIEEKNVSIRMRDGSTVTMGVDEFVEKITKEIKDRV